MLRTELSTVGALTLPFALTRDMASATDRPRSPAADSDAHLPAGAGAVTAATATALTTGLPGVGTAAAAWPRRMGWFNGRAEEDMERDALSAKAMQTATDGTHARTQLSQGRSVGRAKIHEQQRTLQLFRAR